MSFFKKAFLQYAPSHGSKLLRPIYSINIHHQEFQFVQAVTGLVGGECSEDREIVQTHFHWIGSGFGRRADWSRAVIHNLNSILLFYVLIPRF